MTLSTSRRISIFQKLVPVLGEGDADALMAEFPATEYDQLVTRDHLRAELVLVRAEIQALHGSVRAEIQTVDTNVRTDMQALDTNLRAEIQSVDTNVRTDMRALEANLRTEIHDLRVEMHASFARAYVVVAGAIGGSLVGGMGLAAAIG